MQSDHSRGLFIGVWLEDLTQPAQTARGGCGVSILRDIQNLSRHSPGQSAPGGPAWAGGTQDDPRRSLPTSIILWFSSKPKKPEIVQAHQIRVWRRQRKSSLGSVSGQRRQDACGDCTDSAKSAFLFPVQWKCLQCYRELMAPLARLLVLFIVLPCLLYLMNLSMHKVFKLP